jgi:VanZ family protein
MAQYAARTLKDSAPLLMPSSSSPFSKFRERFRFWIPAILVALAISIFSTHYFSPEETGRVILPVIRWFLPDASPDLLRRLHTGIRKMAHVIEFGTFSAAVFHGIRGPSTGWTFRWSLYTLLIAFSYSAFDEFHQVFVRLRHATPKDAVIDGLGALLAQLLVWCYAKKKWPLAALSRMLTAGKDQCH